MRLRLRDTMTRNTTTIRGPLAGAALLLLVLAASAAEAAGGVASTSSSIQAADTADIHGIGWIVHEEIAARHIPGAVVLIGDRHRVLYRRAFGHRLLGPGPKRMTTGAVFDLASLTKVVATTTAVMQLIEGGRLRLDEPVARYWPAFAARGKASITVRELLTHTSGLQADLDLRRPWRGRRAALRLIVALRPRSPPGARYLYSDVNFIVLGELVRRISGMPLDAYCARHIFRPLGMARTRFRPPPAWFARIAPTGYAHGRLLLGRVNDPTARRMGGVAGHAGLFSTADDLARFARMILRGGVAPSRHGGRRILTQASIRLMSRPERVGPRRFRGLGWDVTAPFVADRDALPPYGAIGHTGYTGTGLWIDPVSGLYLIVLTNRVYPDGHGDAQPLRRALSALLAFGRSSEPGNLVSPSARGRLETGIDVLSADDFAELRGLRVGLITNQSGRTATGRRTIDLLRRAPGVRLVALFSPEHGLDGRDDGRVPDSVDPATGLRVYSLYGRVRRPTGSMLAGLDALVFDIQDSGTRFFTYITTMAYAMQSAARHGLRFVVVDRPDPIDAARVEGPLLDRRLESFTGVFPLPLRYGMTIGELARLLDSQAKIGARLEVVRMRGYRRGEWYDQTGLRWVPPSPNLRTVDETALYPGVGMIEGANVSVGRGTHTPFEIIGAPWIDARRLARYLDGRGIPGVRFVPARFVPNADRYAGRPCAGVRILLIDRNALEDGRLGIELASALHRLYPGRFAIDRTVSLIGSEAVLRAIESGRDPRAIARAWQPSLRRFLAVRSRFLLYPDTEPSSSVE